MSPEFRQFDFWLGRWKVTNSQGIWQTARHQDWVGGDGTILHLHGGMRDGSMILTGETKGTKGPVVNRITFKLLPEGKVKQEWAASDDAGESWQISFLGIYEKEH